MKWKFLFLPLMILAISLCSLGAAFALSTDNETDQDGVSGEVSGEVAVLEDIAVDSEAVTDDTVSDVSTPIYNVGPYDLDIDPISDDFVVDGAAASENSVSTSDGDTEESSLEEAVIALTESVDELNETMSAESEEETEAEAEEETEAEAEEETEEAAEEFDADKAFVELGQALLDEQERILYTLWIIAGLIVGVSIGGVICFILL